VRENNTLRKRYIQLTVLPDDETVRNETRRRQWFLSIILNIIQFCAFMGLTYINCIIIYGTENIKNQYWSSGVSCVGTSVVHFVEMVVVFCS